MGKEEGKLFTDGMIYREDPKDPTEKVLETIAQYKKVVKLQNQHKKMLLHSYMQIYIYNIFK